MKCKIKSVDNEGFDPSTSRMLSVRSTNWASRPVNRFYTVCVGVRFGENFVKSSRSCRCINWHLLYKICSTDVIVTSLIFQPLLLCCSKLISCSAVFITHWALSVEGCCLSFVAILLWALKACQSSIVVSCLQWPSFALFKSFQASFWC
jgi:hypothetical protein